MTALDSGLSYQFHHGSVEAFDDDNTVFTRLDGYLSDGTRKIQLDISCLGDECVSSSEAELAPVIWDEGRVLMTKSESHGVNTLIVPDITLNMRSIAEALKRFRP